MPLLNNRSALSSSASVAYMLNKNNRFLFMVEHRSTVDRIASSTVIGCAASTLILCVGNIP